MNTNSLHDKITVSDMATLLTLKAPIPQNGQTHSNNSSATADELFERVWPFCKVDA